ncbi:hypothetical protein B0H63DRAFT_520390 [Podospora didyma]|uniref:DUF8021 domain-containing protein n=1 Tax=Podospora didyma TaxID=330526 RepID=A0AAE0P0M7_9PEZI|nr:hypothetical protein B0H63DRAFT_520390 [Podospora didyma]
MTTTILPWFSLLSAALALATLAPVADPLCSRELLQSHTATYMAAQTTADAYLDLFNHPTVMGGILTGNGSATDSCNVGVPTGVMIFDRRYVIDEVLGTVDCFVTFQTRPDSHEFRAENEKLRFVHTLTVMRNGVERLR